MGNQAITACLGVSPKTIANAVSGVLVELGVRDRAEAVAAARAAGLATG
ncbi:hypothetical protein [Microbispora sp. NPDC049633]